MEQLIVKAILKASNETHNDHEIHHHTIKQVVDGAEKPLVFAWSFAGILCFLSLVSFFWQLHRHLNAFQPYKLYAPKSVMSMPARESAAPEGWREAVQNDRTAYAYKRHAILMILMIPIFSVTSYLSMWILRLAVVFEFIRAIYESVILYVFLLIMANMLGGLKKAPSVMINIPRGNYLAVPPLACCCRPCCPHIRITPRWLSTIKVLVIQYCIVKPVTIALALIFYFAGGQDPESADQPRFVILRLIGVVSVLLCAYGLFIFYKATHDILAEYRTGLKFAAVKAIVLLAAIQGVVIQGLINAGRVKGTDFLTPEEQGEIWNNFLLVVEMFIISFLFAAAFPLSDYKRGVIGVPEEQVEEAVKNHPHPDEEVGQVDLNEL
jgi:hypothetical protein